MAAVSGTPDQLSSDGYVSDDVRHPENKAVAPSMSAIENTLLAFPSLMTGHLTSSVVELRDHECRLRRAKANDCLGYVKEKLSCLSYQYMNKVRKATTTRENLRSYSGVKLLSKEVSFYQQVYNRNSRVIGRLDGVLKQRYPQLRRSDCKVNTAIADVNARGQSQVRLPWFWAAENGWDGEASSQNIITPDNDRLLECMCSISTPGSVRCC